MTKYVALLRGINVGGKNVISMKSLIDCFSAAGFEGVRTFIQSGNVLFACDSASSAELEVVIERMLLESFETEITTVVRSRDELAATIAAAPANHGSAELLGDVLFLKRPFTAAGQWTSCQNSTTKSIRFRRGRMRSTSRARSSILRSLELIVFGASDCLSE